MKAYEIRGSFGLENLVITDRPDPVPGPGQVVVAVRAVSLNYRDLLMVQGFYNPKQKLPLVPLSDGAGEVVAIGPGVTKVKVGDRVCSLFAQGWMAGQPDRSQLATTLGGPLDGMLSQKVLLTEDGAVPFPSHLSFEEAATLPCAALTAWSALVTHGGLKPGDTLLLLGTGGVSLFGLQFGKMLGARTIITSSSDAKLDRAQKLGASALINYNSTPDWEKKVRSLTDNVGVDHVLEVGGAGTLEKSLRSVKPGGTISLIGVLGGTAGEINLLPLLMQNVRLQGLLVGHRESMVAMFRAIALHQMKPVVDRVFAFGEAKAAFEHMQSGSHFGKICLRIGD
jgi:NADPH:quinone reductase-like Zn-dependent oxidoreductase